MVDCPICRTPETDRRDDGGTAIFNCPRCRQFLLSRDTVDDLPGHIRHGPEEDYHRAVLSHAFQRMRGQDRLPTADIQMIERIIRDDRLPNAAVQADIAIRWLGSHLPVPEARSSITL